jgi:hypothetical protein
VNGFLIPRAAHNNRRGIGRRDDDVSVAHNEAAIVQDDVHLALLMTICQTFDFDVWFIGDLEFAQQRIVQETEKKKRRMNDDSKLSSNINSNLPANMYVTKHICTPDLPISDTHKMDDHFPNIYRLKDEKQPLT